MRQGLAAFQMVGTPLGRAAQLVLLAQGYARAGKAEAGLAALDEALTWMGQTGVCMLEAEAHRLRGELLLAGRLAGQALADPTRCEAAEACFRRAIAVARQQARCGGSSAPRSACAGCSGIKAPSSLRIVSPALSVQQLAKPLLRSTASSPKGLNHRTCKRHERCWWSSMQQHRNERLLRFAPQQNYEVLAATSEARIYVAMVQLMLRPTRSQSRRVAVKVQQNF